MMNIKQVEKLTGISSQNIRFYEKSGLIHPKRNEENGYREYNEEDVRLLKLVKMFRMLDMPIEQIKLMLCETDELDNLLRKQEKALEKKLANTKCAIDLCENLRKTHKTIADIDVDSYLNQMEKVPGNYFDKWISDYKDVVQYEHQRTFTFTPDDEIKDLYDFANALYAYAREMDKEITITKEGMYPEFIMDGVEYTAERNYTAVRGIPVAVIRCTRKDAPETDAAYQSGRKKWMRLLHVCWPAVLGMLLLVLLAGPASLKTLFSTMEGALILIAMLVLCVAMSIRNYFFYWNRSDVQEEFTKD